MGDQETTIDIGPESRRSEDDMDNGKRPTVNRTPSQRSQIVSTQGEIVLNVVYHILIVIKYTAQRRLRSVA